jgi:molybdopterin converting factor small subunit
MPTIKIPTPLRTYTSGQGSLALDGNTVRELLDNLVEEYPSIEKHIFAEDKTLRPYVNIFLKDENILELQGLDTPLDIKDTLRIIPSIAGGIFDLQ